MSFAPHLDVIVSAILGFALGFYAAFRLTVSYLVRMRPIWARRIASQIPCATGPYHARVAAISAELGSLSEMAWRKVQAEKRQ